MSFYSTEKQVITDQFTNITEQGRVYNVVFFFVFVFCFVVVIGKFQVGYKFRVHVGERKRERKREPEKEQERERERKREREREHVHCCVQSDKISQCPSGFILGNNLRKKIVTKFYYSKTRQTRS